MAYKECSPTGQAGKTIFLLHGAAFKSQTWVDQVPTMQTLCHHDHRVIAIDLPGIFHSKIAFFLFHLLYSCLVDYFNFQVMVTLGLFATAVLILVIKPSFSWSLSKLPCQEKSPSLCRLPCPVPSPFLSWRSIKVLNQNHKCKL